MQLSLFSSSGAVQETPACLCQKLTFTTLPDLQAALDRLGTVEDWQSRTLSQIHELWYGLFDDFVSVLDEPIAFAKPYGKAGSDAYETADHKTRYHFKMEYNRLKQAQGELRAAIECVYVDRLLSFTDAAVKGLEKMALSEEEINGSDEFLSEAFQRPHPAELGMTMAEFYNGLVLEYAGLPKTASLIHS